MANAERGASPQFTEQKLLLCLHDLAGFARLARDHSDLEIALFLHDYYTANVAAVHQAGGRVLKYMGDAVLSVFPPERAADAVEQMAALARVIEEIGRARRLRIESGCNMHLDTVVEGEFGPEGERRHDVIGSGMNHVHLMGRGPGLRISEPVYRSLPNEARAAWDKVKPPAVYHYKG
ncbi:MAG: adenylate/guanylate cyclase domain-containing protein [Planctomycetota bacterium]|nr:adenylate/guanylate cyclase domain-containing protein [Planctomycetota bacterium]